MAGSNTNGGTSGPPKQTRPDKSEKQDIMQHHSVDEIKVSIAAHLKHLGHQIAQYTESVLKALVGYSHNNQVRHLNFVELGTWLMMIFLSVVIHQQHTNANVRDMRWIMMLHLLTYRLYINSRSRVNVGPSAIDVSIAFMFVGIIGTFVIQLPGLIQLGPCFHQQQDIYQWCSSGQDRFQPYITCVQDKDRLCPSDQPWLNTVVFLIIALDLLLFVLFTATEIKILEKPRLEKLHQGAAFLHLEKIAK